jgi:hypothetical protein
LFKTIHSFRVHPKYKHDVGYRLSRSGLAIAYGQQVEFQGPIVPGLERGHPARWPGSARPGPGLARSSLESPTCRAGRALLEKTDGLGKPKFLSGRPDRILFLFFVKNFLFKKKENN